MKKIIILIAVVVVLGAFWWQDRVAEAPVDQEDMAQKVDMNVVCEEALAYMSFPDAVAAEKFVADCKAGLYPEVLERYKADMGIDADAQI
jgi:hypothetical protein